MPARTTATVLVEATAVANGSTPVTVQLLSPGGSPVGRPRTLDVVATGYGLVGWLVIGLGGAVLVGAATVRTVRRLRARGAAPAAPDPAPSPAGATR